MPKKVYKINNFHGGLNNSSDPRDVDDKEITAATNVMVDEVGRVRLSGSNVAHEALVLDNTGAGFTDATCDYNNDPTVTCNANTSIEVGMSVTGTGIPINNYITAITEGGGAGTGVTTFELNAATTDGAVTNGTLTFISQTPGSGLFYFSHDRKGGEDAGDDEDETNDDYLALYDDADAQVWVYSDAGSDWDDDKDIPENGVINFIGKTTGAVARPCFFSVDGALRVSTGEFAKYDSGTDINMGSHLLVTAVALTVDNGAVFAVGNYIQIDDEILFVSAIATHVLTVTRSMFGTKDTQHQDGADIYILNMNQWYGYLNNNFFQTSVGVSEYTTNKWYNEIQHLRSLDELGISLALDDSSSASPDATALVGDKIIVAHWLSKDGFWSGSYWIGMTPVYLGGQEGPISDVGTDTVQLNEEILNVQLFICHPTIDSATVATHPLKDDRIIGLNLYTRSYTSDEWFLLKRFDLLEGGKHGWTEYNDGQTATGFWTDGSAALADPASLDSYDKTTAVLTVTPGTAMGTGRKGIARVSGFEVSPLYATVDLDSTSAQNTPLNVVNPGPGLKKFVLEVLDENYDVLNTTQIEKTIADSGSSAPDYPEYGGYGGES